MTEKRYVDIVPLTQEVNKSLSKMKEILSVAIEDNNTWLIQRQTDAVRTLELFLMSLNNIPTADVKPIIRATKRNYQSSNLSYCGYCGSLIKGRNYCECCGAEIIHSKQEVKNLKDKGKIVYEAE